MSNSKYKFQQASAIERSLASKLAKKLNVQFVPAPELCNYDCVFERDGIISIVECKVRTFKHNQYDTSLLEKAKYENLMSFMYNNKCNKVLYIQFYSDDVALIWNLANIKQDWSEAAFVKTTMGNQIKKLKTVTFLPIKDAKLINLKEEPIKNEEPKQHRGTSLF